MALYRKLLARVPHEIVTIRNARSLAEAYNWAVRNSVADVIVLSHDDVDVLADDFVARLFDHLRSFDALGVVGSTRAGALLSSRNSERLVRKNWCVAW